MSRTSILVFLACAGSVGCFSSSNGEPPDAGPGETSLDGSDASTDSSSEASPSDATVHDGSYTDGSAADAGDGAPSGEDDGASTVPCPSVDGGSTPAPSCAPVGPGTSSCGANGESCCTSLEVPCGTFYRVYNDGNSTSGPPDGGWPDESYPATISGFRLDKYAVTVGRFRQFVNAVLPPDGGVGWLPPAGSGKHTHLNGGLGLVLSDPTNDGGDPPVYEPGWDDVDWNAEVVPTNANLACLPGFDTWTDTPGSQENLPINCVNWFEAYAFCVWDGGFMPSSAEWEYAAAGGSEQRNFPWGSTAPGTACPGTGCAYAIYNCDYPSGSGSCTGTANLAPVGTATLGAGRWGQLDVAGNVSQWNQDVNGMFVDPCTDCAVLSSAIVGPRGLGGGYFNGPASYLLPTLGSSGGVAGPPTGRDLRLGLRCARTP